MTAFESELEKQRPDFVQAYLSSFYSNQGWFSFKYYKYTFSFSNLRLFLSNFNVQLIIHAHKSNYLQFRDL